MHYFEELSAEWLHLWACAHRHVHHFMTEASSGWLVPLNKQSQIKHHTVFELLSSSYSKHIFPSSGFGSHIQEIMQHACTPGPVFIFPKSALTQVCHDILWQGVPQIKRTVCTDALCLGLPPICFISSSKHSVFWQGSHDTENSHCFQWDSQFTEHYSLCPSEN